MTGVLGALTRGDTATAPATGTASQTRPAEAWGLRGAAGVAARPAAPGECPRPLVPHSEEEREAEGRAHPSGSHPTRGTLRYPQESPESAQGGGEQLRSSSVDRPPQGCGDGRGADLRPGRGLSLSPPPSSSSGVSPETWWRAKQEVPPPRRRHRRRGRSRWREEAGKPAAGGRGDAEARVPEEGPEKPDQGRRLKGS